MDGVLLKHQNSGEDRMLLKAFNELPYAKEMWVRRNMKTLREKATKHELEIAKYLDDNGIHFVSQAPFYFKDTDSIYFADFYVARKRVVIEVDGGYHNEIEKRTSDIIRDEFFAQKRIRVIRIPNSEVGTSKVPDKLGFLNPKPKKKKKPQQKKDEDVLDERTYVQMLRFVIEKMNSAEDGSTLVFKTSHKKIALSILKSTKKTINLRHALRKEIEEIKSVKRLRVIALFVGKQSKKWMSKHLLNPVTVSYISYTREASKEEIIAIPETFVN